MRVGAQLLHHNYHEEKVDDYKTPMVLVEVEGAAMA
jgi:hypothetical protein